MKCFGSRVALAAAMLAGVLGAQPAWADFTFDGKVCSAYSSTTCSATSTITRNGTGADSGNSVTATAWSAPSGVKFAGTKMTVYGTSGIGISPDTGEGTSEHGMDNLGNTDAVVLSFNQSTILNSVRIGWTGGNDSDISVLRWVGDASGPTAGAGPNMADMKWDTLASSGWELVGSYSDLGTVARGLGNTTKGSSWWMVSAYNATYGGSIKKPTGGGSEFDYGDDYFKLAAVGGSLCTAGGGVSCGGSSAVPEPGSLALLMLGFVAAAGAMRKQRR